MTTEADIRLRAVASPLRRRDRGRQLEEEWRAGWEGIEADPTCLDLRPDEDQPGGDWAAYPDAWDGSGSDSTIEMPALAITPGMKIRVSSPPPTAASPTMTPTLTPTSPAPSSPTPASDATPSTAGPPASSLRPPAPAPLGWRDAVLRYRRAAVAMALAIGTDDVFRADAREAATCLLALASGGHEAVLTAILRADPAAAEATWTVACYQIGDISPSGLRDYAEAAPALLTLAGCETASHVAAELIVTNGDGVRWTALVRSGADVVYQPLTPASATAASTSALLAVRHAWEDQLLQWASSPDHGLDQAPEPPVDAASAGGDQAAMGVVLGQVLEAVRHIEQRLPDPAAAPVGRTGGDVARRVTALEMAAEGLPAMKADLERVTRHAQELEDRLRLADERLAASEARAAQLDARLGDLRRVSARPAPEHMAARRRPPGLAVVLVRWMAARLTWWSDRHSEATIPVASRRIDLVPAEQWPSDWPQ